MKKPCKAGLAASLRACSGQCNDRPQGQAKPCGDITARGPSRIWPADPSAPAPRHTRYELWTPADAGSAAEMLQLVNAQGAQGYRSLGRVCVAEGQPDPVIFIRDEATRYLYQVQSGTTGGADFLREANHMGQRGFRFDPAAGATQTALGPLGGALRFYRHDRQSLARYDYRQALAARAHAPSVEFLACLNAMGLQGYRYLLQPRRPAGDGSGPVEGGLFERETGGRTVFRYTALPMAWSEAKWLDQLNELGAQGYRLLGFKTLAQGVMGLFELDAVRCMSYRYFQRPCEASVDALVVQANHEGEHGAQIDSVSRQASPGAFDTVVYVQSINWGTQLDTLQQQERAFAQ